MSVTVAISRSHPFLGRRVEAEQGTPVQRKTMMRRPKTYAVNNFCPRETCRIWGGWPLSSSWSRSSRKATKTMPTSKTRKKELVASCEWDFSRRCLAMGGAIQEGGPGWGIGWGYS